VKRREFLAARSERGSRWIIGSGPRAMKQRIWRAWTQAHGRAQHFGSRIEVQALGLPAGPSTNSLSPALTDGARAGARSSVELLEPDEWAVPSATDSRARWATHRA